MKDKTEYINYICINCGKKYSYPKQPIKCFAEFYCDICDEMLEVYNEDNNYNEMGDL